MQESVFATSLDMEKDIDLFWQKTESNKLYFHKLFVVVYNRRKRKIIRLKLYLQRKSARKKSNKMIITS